MSAGRLVGRGGQGDGEADGARGDPRRGGQDPAAAAANGLRRDGLLGREAGGAALLAQLALGGGVRGHGAKLLWLGDGVGAPHGGAARTGGSAEVEGWRAAGGREREQRRRAAHGRRGRGEGDDGRSAGPQRAGPQRAQQRRGARGRGERGSAAAAGATRSASAIRPPARRQRTSSTAQPPPSTAPECSASASSAWPPQTAATPALPTSHRRATGAGWAPSGGRTARPAAA